jgi:subtilisin family serine protease
LSAQGAQFGPQYAAYKGFVNLPLPPFASADIVKVLLLDTGIAADAGPSNLTIDHEVNFIDPTNPRAEDDHGHGTALALLIADLAPTAHFTIFKVADKDGKVSDWNALAGLIAYVDAGPITA